MREVAGEERVEAAVHEVEFAEGKVVEVGVHLVARPRQVHKVEQRVQEHYQVPDVTLRQPTDQQLHQSIEAAPPGPATRAEVSSKLPQEVCARLRGVEQMRFGHERLEEPVVSIENTFCLFRF